MDFTLSDEQRQFQHSVRTFARRELAEKALSRAHDPAYPWDVAHALATHGLLGLTIPAEDGGGYVPVPTWTTDATHVTGTVSQLSTVVAAIALE